MMAPLGPQPEDALWDALTALASGEGCPLVRLPLALLHPAALCDKAVLPELPDSLSQSVSSHYCTTAVTATATTATVQD